jgi:hypothetical protein
LSKCGCALISLLSMIIIFAEIPNAYAVSQTASLEVVSTIKLDKQPLLMSVDAETNRVLLGFEDVATYINGSTKQVLETFPVNATASYKEPTYDLNVSSWVWNSIKLQSNWQYVNLTRSIRANMYFGQGTNLYQFVYNGANSSALYVANANNVYASVNFTNTPAAVLNPNTGEVYVLQVSPYQIIVLQGPCATRPILVTDLSISPQQPQIGNQITISFKVRNLSANSSTFVPTVKVGNSELSQTQVTLGNGENRTLTFTTVISAPGNYTVTAEGLSTSFQVQAIPEFSPTIFLVLGVFATLVTLVVWRKTKSSSRQTMKTCKRRYDVGSAGFLRCVCSIFRLCRFSCCRIEGSLRLVLPIFLPPWSFLVPNMLSLTKKEGNLRKTSPTSLRNIPPYDMSNILQLFPLAS